MKVKYMNIKHNLNKMMKMKLKQNQTKQYCSAMNIIRIENERPSHVNKYSRILKMMMKYDRCLFSCRSIPRKIIELHQPVAVLCSIE